MPPSARAHRVSPRRAPPPPRSPAFIRKDTWVKQGGREVVIVAHWTSRNARHSLPPEWFTGIEDRFNAAVGGAENYSMTESIDDNPVPVPPAPAK